jgi:hypothetical protein
MDAVLFVLIWRRNQGASGFASLGLHNDAYQAAGVVLASPSRSPVSRLRALSLRQPLSCALREARARKSRPFPNRQDYHDKSKTISGSHILPTRF